MTLCPQSLGGHIISRHCYSDLNPVLSVGNATLNLLSEGELHPEQLLKSFRLALFFTLKSQLTVGSACREESAL